MPPSSEAVRRFKRQLRLYRERTGLLVVAAFDALPAYNEPDVEAFAEATAPIYASAKTATVGLSAAFYAIAFGSRPSGVSPADVQVELDPRTPFLALWHALSEGRPSEQAVDVGRSTASAEAFGFVQSTARRTGDAVAQATGRNVAWRRVPSVGACKWCRDIADQLYRSAESADFGHQRCDCDAVPA